MAGAGEVRGGERREMGTRKRGAGHGEHVSFSLNDTASPRRVARWLTQLRCYNDHLCCGGRPRTGAICPWPVFSARGSRI